MNKVLSNLMKEDLESIDSMLRVTTNFGIVLRAADKEFLLCCNYRKGHGDEFKACIVKYHPGNKYSSLSCSLERGSGSRQYYTINGAGAVYE